MIILGAARSGTKLLRRLVAATGCYAEVPFDVNYIWRYGNETCPHDALLPGQLTPRIKQFVRAWIRNCAGLVEDGAAFVEKTVSNVLRPQFCHGVFPDAKYIVIVRDGRDVVQSAVRCWREPPNVGYLATKLRTFPWLHCASYGRKYLAANAARLLGLMPHVRTWGPRYPGIDGDVGRLNLHEVCARQWLAAVQHFEGARSIFATNQLLEVRYEELIHGPDQQIARLCDFLEIDDRHTVYGYARQTICPPVGGSNEQRLLDGRDQALEILHPALERLGYAHRHCELAAELAASKS